MSPGSGLAYRYEEVASACRRGEYPSAVIRTASGRANYLLGVTPQRLRLLRRKAREAGVGLILLGSRVSGPRLRQQKLHPALEAALPLKALKRTASALFAGVEGVEIDKTVIKDFGPDDVHTSDLSVVIVDAARSPEQMQALAVEFETFFKAQDWGFPVRFFAELSGVYMRGEADFLADGERYLRTLLPPGRAFSPDELRDAMSELYFAVNLRRRWLTAADARNGVVTAVLISATFSIAFGLRWPFVPIGFSLGLIGRYLARLRAGIAFSLGDGIAANAAALVADGCLGAAIMAAVINPLAGLGVPLSMIAAGSVSHTLAKGSLRLFLEKTFSLGNDRRQGRGVLIVTALNFMQGAVTSYVYAGSHLALAIQLVMCALGVFLLFGPSLRRLA